MCFSGPMSAGFAALGIFMAWWVNARTSNFQLATGIFFYFTMELLQAIQYIYIAGGLASPQCDEFMNQFLTIIGFLHICLQPYYCHVINQSLCQRPSKDKSEEHNRKLLKYHYQYDIIKRLCLMGGLLIFLRWPMAYVPGWNTMDVSSIDGIGKSTEWVRGEKVCTFKSKAMIHLGWSVPMADATYNIQGIGLHSFLMFAPFFALYEKTGMILQGCVLYFSGPVLASLISPNLMEQASIWCFYSIAQIAIMLFLIRETLLCNWGKKGLLADSKAKAKQQ